MTRRDEDHHTRVDAVFKKYDADASGSTPS